MTRENIDSREGFSLEEEMEYMDSARSPQGWESIEADEEPTTEDLEEMCDYFESLDMDDFEDDGQPDEQQEWDDLYGYGPEYDCYDHYDEY